MREQPRDLGDPRHAPQQLAPHPEGQQLYRGDKSRPFVAAWAACCMTVDVKQGAAGREPGRSPTAVSSPSELQADWTRWRAMASQSFLCSAASSSGLLATAMAISLLMVRASWTASCSSWGADWPSCLS